MPELVATWQRLTAMLGDDPAAGAALALWNPPPGTWDRLARQP